jgi:flavorubredoxin
MLADHLHVPADRMTAVADGETLDLGGKTLEFVYTPWVHWPETMSTYLREDRILFSCDFFGAHLATSDLAATDAPRVLEAAKRYFAEIMLPTRNIIRNNMEKLKRLAVDVIAPSHGPVHVRPALILDAYREWASDRPRNLAAVAYVTMHGSTRKLVRRLVEALVERGVAVEQFDLAATDLGKLATALVDAATLVVGAPVVNAAPHPAASHAAALANVLRPKARCVGLVGSYGWSGKPLEGLAGQMPNVKAELLPPVLCKGLPREADFAAVAKLAETIAEKHRTLGLA